MEIDMMDTEYCKFSLTSSILDTSILPRGARRICQQHPSALSQAQAEEAIPWNLLGNDGVTRPMLMYLSTPRALGHSRGLGAVDLTSSLLPESVTDPFRGLVFGAGNRLGETYFWFFLGGVFAY